MTYSIVHQGEVLDYRYLPSHGPDQELMAYNFYIGENFLGQIFKVRTAWAAVAWGKCQGLPLVHGFKTRHHASDYILKVTGYCK